MGEYSTGDPLSSGLMAKQDHVNAAHGLGAPHHHIILQHALPQVLMLAVGEFIQVTGQTILLEASLSFLGLGDPLQKAGTRLCTGHRFAAHFCYLLDCGGYYHLVYSFASPPSVLR